SVGYATVHNGRSDSRLTDSVTMLVHTVPVTAEPDGEKKTADFVRSMQDQLAESQSRDACSFAELSADYGANADLIFIYQGDDFTFDRLCGEKAEMIDVGLDAAKAPLSLNVYRRGEHYELVTEYRRDTYSKAFAESLSDALISAAVSFTKSELIRDVTMKSVRSEEIYSILNDSDADIRNVSVPEMISRAAVLSPDEPAVTSDGRTLTYREFEEMSNIMAHGLIKAGVRTDSVVGIILERSCEIPLSQFAILKAGGAFLAILPSYPDDRIEYCLTDADSPCVITTEEIKASRPELFSADKPYLTLTLEELLKGEEKCAPDVGIAPESLAYCIYTSGSTGKPKGVMIEHRNFSNMVQTFTPTLRYFSENVPGAALASCSVSFDASVMEIFLPLCSGRHLYMTTEEEYHDPMAMKRLIIENNVRHMVSTPAYLTSLAGMPEIVPVFGQLASIMVGAEAFPGVLYESLRRSAPDLQIFNGYGPSECTVCCSSKELHSSRNITRVKSSGNVRQYVVDKFGHVLPPYAAGELIICGAGVGRGYVKLPEKTAASFFEMNGMRAYHSGDFVRLNGDGEIDFCGRIDNQIKLRGFRIELDEIEKVMSSYPSVRQSKVIVRSNGSEDYLAGFFTASEKVDIDALTSHLKASLTYYMVPAVLMQLDEMPLTQNGKIDKNGFPEVQKSARKTAGRRAAKQSLEQRLCEIFAQVLGLDEVFADDNFFELGGTSLTASKVTMILMSDNIDVKYGDIFDNPTPESLSEFIEERDGSKKTVEKAEKLEDASKTREALKYNTVKYAAEATREELGNVLLTGAVGFLGIHILSELLETEKGHIYCLVRRGSHETPEIRLKSMLFYYFGRSFDAEMSERITVIDADITDG
ncbi:MAG: amino acid adenylation domain-containing protein, partial [Clostridia bacterium]|nr:amino acid adenylation domain-containing protein [Clostridia bacterium]